MIRHHPSEATLLCFAAGSLPEAHARVVAMHLAACPGCSRSSGEMEELGGGLLDAAPPLALSSNALERTLARLDSAPEEPKPGPTVFDLLAAGRWRWSGPGVAVMPLISRDAADSRLDLIRVAPGSALLEHGHAGFETTCVVRGAFDDGVGRYRQGDFVEADGTLDHRPMALPGEECICLVATTGRLSPRGPIGWLVRPLLGF